MRKRSRRTILKVSICGVGKIESLEDMEKNAPIDGGIFLQKNFTKTISSSFKEQLWPMNAIFKLGSRKKSQTRQLLSCQLMKTISIG